LLCDAEKLPFPGNFFDCVSLAFGLRNMTHKEIALAEILRVLRPGGRLLVLEFSKIWKPLQRLYDTYSFQVLPKLGKLITGDPDSYRYLAESIRMHPDQEQLREMMELAGFEKVEYFNLAAGVVALHKAYKF
jgi:demethylmenaquinone methyltransferase/2-methoxy-6-polyprenyl-1,4-benzoquinol methylase